MRKTIAFLLGVLMLLAAAVMPVAAETTAPAAESTPPVAEEPVADETVAVTESMQIFEKTYTLHMDQYRGEIVSDTLAAAFWEYPVFAQGQRYIVDGLLVVRNDSQMVADVKLDNISLPYGDEQKMNYLNHLMITVTELTEETVSQTQPTVADETAPTNEVTAVDEAVADDETVSVDETVAVDTTTVQKETVLFDGPYSRINDVDGGLHLVYENMQPDETHTYRINMRCLYTYDGDPNADTSWLKWNFSAHSRTTIVYEEEQGLPRWAKLTLMILAVTIALLILITIIVGIVSLIKNAKERKAAKLEQRDIKEEKKAAKQRRKEEKLAQKEAAKRLKEEGKYHPSPDDQEDELVFDDEASEEAVTEETIEEDSQEAVEATEEEAVEGETSAKKDPAEESVEEEVSADEEPEEENTEE